MAGQELRAELVLRPPGTITGKVRGADGSPLSDASVSLSSMSARNERTVRTDSAGTFRFEDLPPNDYYWLRAALESGLAATGSVSLALGASEHVVLAIAAEEPVQLSGRWLAAREPHESIYLGFDAKSGRGDSSCQVQEDGTFATLLPCPGEYSVRAQLFAGSDNLMWFTDVVIPALPEHELELRPPFAWVCGRVLDRDGHPLAAVSVSVREKPWSSTATDAEGRYRLRVAAGTKLMEAGGPRSGNTSRSWAPARTTVEVREGETSENIDFRLDVGGRLRGRVRFPDGTPAADATIRAVSGDESRYFGQCGSDGRFDLDGLESGLLHVSATTMRRTHASPELPVLIRVGETSEVELVLAPR